MSVCFVGSFGFLYFFGSSPPPQAQGTSLLISWAPNVACNPAVAGAATASAYTQSAPITMSLFTHSLYRADFALSLSPQTGLPSTAGLTTPNPANAVVAILWHQGERMFEHLIMF